MTREPMRVLMINYEFPPIGGGCGVACWNLLREVALEPGLEIDLVTSGITAGIERPYGGNTVTVHRLGVAKRDLHFWRAQELADWSWQALRYATGCD